MSDNRGMDATGLFGGMEKLPQSIPGQRTITTDYPDTVPSHDRAVLAASTLPKPDEAEKEARRKQTDRKTKKKTGKTAPEPQSALDTHIDYSATTSPLSVRITDDMRKELSALSRATGKTVSSLVVEALNTYIDETIDLTDTQQLIYDALMQNNDV